jgi:hypothetical protein
MGNTSPVFIVIDTSVFPYGYKCICFTDSHTQRQTHTHTLTDSHTHRYLDNKDARASDWTLEDLIVAGFFLIVFYQRGE